VDNSRQIISLSKSHVDRKSVFLTTLVDSQESQDKQQ